MSALPQSAPLGAVEPPLGDVVAVLRQRLGVRVQDALRPELQDAMSRARSLGHGASPAEIARRLRDVPDGDGLLGLFAEALSIGETSFYRAPSQLDALVALTCEELLAQRRARGLRILRVWSAGCATGEEVYTLAALFSAAAPDFLVQVVGGDFNERSLAIAREGSFPERSVRGPLPVALEAHLRRTARGWRVSDELKAKTSFVPVNLALDPLPDPERGLAGFDVVLCRNVLIYVDEQRLPDVMRKLAASAMERCIIGVGPAEYRVAAHLPGFRDVGQALLLRTEATSPVRPLPTPRPSPVLTAVPPPVRPAPPRAVSTAPAPAAPDLATLLGRARKLADDARLADAWRALEELLRAFPDASDAHLLAGELHAAGGELEKAAAAYRRALFLDDRSVAAELGLGECHAKLGRPKEGRRAFWRALRLLEGHDPGETIATIDLPVVAVRRLVQQRLFELEDA